MKTHSLAGKISISLRSANNKRHFERNKENFNKSGGLFRMMMYETSQKGEQNGR